MIKSSSNLATTTLFVKGEKMTQPTCPTFVTWPIYALGAEGFSDICRLRDAPRQDNQHLCWRCRIGTSFGMTAHRRQGTAVIRILRTSWPPPLSPLCPSLVKPHTRRVPVVVGQSRRRFCCQPMTLTRRCREGRQARKRFPGSSGGLVGWDLEWLQLCGSLQVGLSLTMWLSHRQHDGIKGQVSLAFNSYW